MCMNTGCFILGTYSTATMKLRCVTHLYALFAIQQWHSLPASTYSTKQQLYPLPQSIHSSMHAEN